MKLRLDANDKVRTLVVLESVAPNDALVIKAGIQKLLLDKGVSRIILDFSEAQAVPHEIKDILQTLKEQAPIYECTFLIAGAQSALQGLATGKTVAEVQAAYQNRTPLDILKERSQLLQTRQEKLKRQKEEIEKKLTTLSQDKNDPKRILKTHSDLKRLVAKFEAEIAVKLAARKTEPIESETGKWEHVRGIVFSVLESEGVVKAKTK